MDIFSLAFMQRALIAALLSGLIAPAIGTYVVQRRLSLLGDGLGHVAIAGVGLSFLTNTAPLPLAIGVCVAGAVGVELLRQRGRATGDVGLAVLFYGGLAAGVMMAGIAGQGAGALSQFLFGSLTTVTTGDLWTIAALGVVVLGLSIGLAPQLFAVCVDEDHAKTQGLPVRWLNLLIVVLAAVTITVSMRTVGLLLVSAMMVIPVATAANVVSGFRRSLLTAMTLGAVVSLGGTASSYWLNTASGATIVVFAIAAFLLSWPVTAFTQRRRLAQATAAFDSAEPAGLRLAEHRIVAAEENCDPDEHLAIQHGDHVDYLHGTHRHAPHGDHFDEH